MDNNKNYLAIYIVVSIVLALLLFVMAVLRATGFAMIPLVIVFAPLWVPFALVAIILAIAIFIAAVKNIKYNARSRYITKELHND